MAEVASPLEAEVHLESIENDLKNLDLEQKQDTGSKSGENSKTDQKSEPEIVNRQKTESSDEEPQGDQYSYNPETGFGAASSSTHYALNNFQHDHRMRKEQRAIDTVTVDLVRRPDEGWGLKIIGSGPCYVEKVKPGGPADYRKKLNRV